MSVLNKNRSWTEALSALLWMGGRELRGKVTEAQQRF